MLDLYLLKGDKNLERIDARLNKTVSGGQKKAKKY